MRRTAKASTSRGTALRVHFQNDRRLNLRLPAQSDEPDPPKDEGNVARRAEVAIDDEMRIFVQVREDMDGIDMISKLREKGIDHLLIDLPSVDREQDNGQLLAHHAFWNYPEQTRLQSTITEFIYVPNEVADGMYLLNMQIAPFENDASPSKPVLYAFE